LISSNIVDNIIRPAESINDENKKNCIEVANDFHGYAWNIIVTTIALYYNENPWIYCIILIQ
jgi:hypothetical protein